MALFLRDVQKTFSFYSSSQKFAHPLTLTDACQRSFQPQSCVATNRRVASPPAVIARHTTVGHNAPVVPNYL